MVDCGCLWSIVVDCGRLWLIVVDCGCLWSIVVDCGRLIVVDCLFTFFDCLNVEQLLDQFYFLLFSCSTHLTMLLGC